MKNSKLWQVDQRNVTHESKLRSKYQRKKNIKCYNYDLEYTLFVHEK